VSALVSLVGAGPGDPDLLTLKALRRLQEADLVLYDALVSPPVVALAAGARRFGVGKRAGRRGVEQETINRLLVRAARRGQRVVRLKCGDPFLLGRGGEEALALAAAGVPFEVVPGVSSALAAPALAGVPVTHRGLSSGVLVVSGHAESAWRPALDGLRPGSVTVVVLMGLAARAAVAAGLMERGWAGDTPAAVLWAASTPEAAIWTGTLSGLGAAVVPETAADAPGTVVVGKVVALARVLGMERASAEVVEAPTGTGRRRTT
jgi:uroporphyrin-III C-methyltransferase/precorrin-2 dehydrogenase/sirohydrochlorin ferrochelatase